MRQSLKNPGVGPVWCIIPARLDSTRLPRKLLRNDHGEALILSTVLNAKRAGCFDVICVVTDSEEIAKEIERWDWSGDVRPAVIIRKGEFRNGTERVASMFAGKVIAGDPALVVGLQADEPEVPADAFRRLIFGAVQHPAVDGATLVGRLFPEDYRNRNVVKACVRVPQWEDFILNGGICDSFYRQLKCGEVELFEKSGARILHHCGVYAWRPSALRWYASLAQSSDESCFGLEQYRVCNNGGKFRAVFATDLFPGIDDEESYQAFCRRFHGRDADGRPVAQ